MKEDGRKASNAFIVLWRALSLKPPLTSMKPSTHAIYRFWTRLRKKLKKFEIIFESEPVRYIICKNILIRIGIPVIRENRIFQLYSFKKAFLFDFEKISLYSVVLPSEPIEANLAMLYIIK